MLAGRSLLYGRPAIERGPFSFRRLADQHPLALLAQFLGVGDSGLLARRSRFTRETGPLLVCECFTPAFWARVAWLDDFRQVG